MSFDMRYPNRKDWRKPYYGAKAVDATCRNHGTCPYCESGRKHAAIRRAPADADDQIRDAFYGLSWRDLQEIKAGQENDEYEFDDLDDYLWMQDEYYYGIYEILSNGKGECYE